MHCYLVVYEPIYKLNRYKYTGGESPWLPSAPFPRPSTSTLHIYSDKPFHNISVCSIVLMPVIRTLALMCRPYAPYPCLMLPLCALCSLPLCSLPYVPYLAAVCALCSSPLCSLPYVPYVPYPCLMLPFALCCSLPYVACLAALCSLPCCPRCRYRYRGAANDTAVPLTIPRCR